jgi:hypothetical protein
MSSDWSNSGGRKGACYFSAKAGNVALRFVDARVDCSLSLQWNGTRLRHRSGAYWRDK